MLVRFRPLDFGSGLGNLTRPKQDSNTFLFLKFTLMNPFLFSVLHKAVEAVLNLNYKSFIILLLLPDLINTMKALQMIYEARYNDGKSTYADLENLKNS